MSNQANEQGTASRLERLLLTSSDAELFGGKLYEIQGYVELVDALAAQTDAKRAAGISQREGSTSFENSPTVPTGPKRHAG